MKFSILIPVVRPQNISSIKEAIYQNAGIPADNIEVLTLYDVEREGCPKTLKKLVEHATHRFLVFIGDDCIPEDNFLLNTLKYLEEGAQLVGFNDGYISGPKHCTHFVADRNILRELEGGEFFSTAYAHCFADNELTEVALEKGWYVYAEDVKILHNNPIVKSKGFSSAEELPDPDLRRVYAADVYEKDRLTFLHRRILRRKRQGIEKIAIAFPIIDDRVYSKFFVSFAVAEKPERYTLLLPTFPSGDFPNSIAAVRNNLAWQALVLGCTKVFMVDTDQVYPPNAFVRLLELSKSAPVVGARVHRRYVPFDPILMRGDNYILSHVPDEESLSGGVIEVDATGAGCLLIDTEVFFHVKRPWYREIINPRNRRPVGEDIYFTQNVHMAGFKILVDTSLEVIHLAMIEVNDQLYKLYKKSSGFSWDNPPSPMEQPRSLNNRLLSEVQHDGMDEPVDEDFAALKMPSFVVDGAGQDSLLAPE